MVTPTRNILTTGVFLQLFRNNSTILVNRPFKLTLCDLTFASPGIALDVMFLEHHGSVTPHKAKDPFLHPPGVAVWGDCDGGPYQGERNRISMMGLC
jgi:hypothetical protein